MLWAQLVHKYINIIIKPLTVVARTGKMLEDIFGNQCFSFMLLAVAIDNTPKAVLYACVAGSTLPFTQAKYDQFRDFF